MTANPFKVHEQNGHITLIELDNLHNYMPVPDATYLRIIQQLANMGLVKLPKRSKSRKTRS